MSDFPINGSCLCGAVSYAINQEPKLNLLCHCRSCQKVTGSGYIALMMVNQDDLDVNGEITWYTASGASGKNVKRGFCGKCGSSMFGIPEVVPGMQSVTASTLDDPSVFKPAMDIWVDDAQAWDCMDPELAKFPQNPEV